MSITELSIKRPLLIIVIFTVLILFGILGYMGLNYELLPKFEAGVISINTTYAGASPQEIESSVTKPIEDAVSTIEGLDIISSRSMENVSAINVQLNAGVNDLTAQQDIERKINQIKSTLPTDADDPVINRFSTDQFPVLNLSVSAAMSDADLYHLVKNNILPEITNVAGVGHVSIIGGAQREIEVKIDNQKLNAFKISVAQVYQALNVASISYPAGEISSHEQELSIRLDADLVKADMIRNTVIRENVNGSRVLLKDIASVTDANISPVTINRTNGKNGIGLQIFKTNDANAVEVSDGVKKKLTELTEEYASNQFGYAIASDQSVYTLASAHAVVNDLFMAVLIVSLVMLMFLHSFRSSMFVLVAIPSALIPTFMMMKIFGFSLNLMTLTALSLVIGILVDDSIVVLENIFRHLEMGKNKVQAALDGRSEISSTAIAITMVDLVVFFPMALTSGLIGNIIRQFSLVVIFSTLMSLFVSFTLTPMLVAKFGRLIHLDNSTFWGRINNGFEYFLDYLKNLYAWLLSWTLGHKKYLFITVGVLMIASVALIPAGFIGKSFLESGDRGQLSLKLELSTDMSLYQTNKAVKQIESIVLKHPEVENVYTLVGTQTGAMGNASNNSNRAQIDLLLNDKRKRKISSDNFGRLMRSEIESQVPGVKVTVVPMTVTGATSSPIQIVVKGAIADSVRTAAEKIKKVVISVPGTDYVNFSTQSDRKQIRIIPDRDKISAMGFTIQDVSQIVSLSFKGNDKLNLKENDNEYSINFVLEDADKQSLTDVFNLTLINKSGKTARLSQLATIEEVTGPSVLERTNRLSSVTITSVAVGRPSGSIVDDIQKRIAKINLPPTVTLEYRGDAKNQKDAFSSLGIALVIAVLLIYLIMVALYESLIYPFVVIFSVPVATIGALLAIALTMNNLTIFTLCGIIMLLGLVAKNGILIVDFTNHLKTKGIPLNEVLIEAGKERLRPIIMTTFAMIIGMLPLALSKSPGSEFKSGMAWVIIGGLTSSFLFTLLLVPSVYMLVERAKNKFGLKKKTEDEVE